MRFQYAIRSWTDSFSYSFSISELNEQQVLSIKYYWVWCHSKRMALKYESQHLNIIEMPISRSHIMPLEQGPLIRARHPCITSVTQRRKVERATWELYVSLSNYKFTIQYKVWSIASPPNLFITQETSSGCRKSSYEYLNYAYNMIGIKCWWYKRAQNFYMR